MVLLALAHVRDQDPRVPAMIHSGVHYLCSVQHHEGGWGGAANVVSSLEETANATSALASLAVHGFTVPAVSQAAQRGAGWLCEATQQGAVFPSSPIGLYFARLWYHEKTYPILWTLAALNRVAAIHS
jgi:squalene-hopene/tetraprenyl-beta-curcumene cyclase